MSTRPVQPARAVVLLIVLAGVGCDPAVGGVPAHGVDAVAREAIGPSGEPLGTVMMTGSCGLEADEPLVPAYALLHLMRYSEAETLFRAAARAEPECALAHWGVAMSRVHPLSSEEPSEEGLREGRTLLLRARRASLSDARTEAFIAALAGYFEAPEGSPETERLVAFRRGWAAAHEAFPYDPEVTAFRALSLLAAAVDAEGDPDRSRALELLGRVAEAVPGHPGARRYAALAGETP